MKINKTALVYGAIVNYKKDTETTLAILNESVENPVFNEIKGKFTDMKEVELYEVFVREPISRRRGLVSPGAIATESNKDRAIRQLNAALSATNLELNAQINKNDVAKLAKAISEISKMADEEGRDSQVRKEALLPLSKAYMRVLELQNYFKGKDKKLEDLKQRYERLRDGLAQRYEERKEEIEALYDPEMMNQIINAQSELQKLKLNKGAVQAKIRAAEAEAERMEPEVSAYEEKLKKKGLFRTVLGKLGLDEEKKINESAVNRWQYLAKIKS